MALLVDRHPLNAQGRTQSVRDHKGRDAKLARCPSLVMSHEFSA